MLLVLGFLLLGMIGPTFAPASNTIFDEVTFKLLDFEFSMLLKNHLRDWRFLTETATVMDTGEFFPKRTFLSHGSRSHSDFISANTTDKNTEKIFNMSISQDTTTKENTSCEHNYDQMCSSKHTPNTGTSTPSKSHEEPQNGTRVARDAGIPVIYMPGSKKKRKCSQVSGLLAGFNTFNYLTFVTGVVTLILNVNNNINNNNNNNNLNNNNDISNNNVNANTNTQNANQVVIFPPGRKRRSIVDLMLQIMTQEAAGNLPSKQSPAGLGSVGSLATEAGMVAIQLFDSWVEATSGVNGECGWAEYCQLLHNLPTKKGMPAVLFNSAREFSSVVAPEWVGSAATCFLHRAKCHLI